MSNVMESSEFFNIFFGQELDYHTQSTRNKFGSRSWPSRNIVSFNIGTANSLNQEVESKWIDRFGETLLNKSFCNVFYFIDKAYSDIQFHNSHIIHIMNRILDNNDTNKPDNKLKFECITNMYKNVETLINKEYSIIVHKIPYNIPTSYNSSKLYERTKINNENIDITYKSVPKDEFWIELYLLFKYFINSHINSKLYINNWVHTNSKIFLNQMSGHPTYVNAYIGVNFEYISEIGYILKYLYTKTDPEYKNNILLKMNGFNLNNQKIDTFNKLYGSNKEFENTWL